MASRAALQLNEIIQHVEMIMTTQSLTECLVLCETMEGVLLAECYKHLLHASSMFHRQSKSTDNILKGKLRLKEQKRLARKKIKLVRIAME